MTVGQEYMIDARQFFQREVGDTGAGVDQHVMVDEQRRGAHVIAAATAENCQFHRHFVSKLVTPSQFSSG